MNKIIDIPKQQLASLDKYLLLNQPLLWSSRIHHIFYWGIIYFFFATSLAIGIAYWTTILPDMTYIKILQALSGIIVFIGWIYSQGMLSYSFQKVDIDKVHFLKVFSLYYLVLIFMIIIQIVPYKILNQGIQERLIDKDLPELKTTQFYEEINQNRRLGPEKYSIYGKKKLSTLEQYTDVSASSSDSIFAYRFVTATKLSNKTLVEHIMEENYSICHPDSNPVKGWISVSPVSYMKNKEIGKIRRIYYNQFSESKTYAKCYGTEVFSRSFIALDSIAKPVRLTVYYYQHKNSGSYRYADSLSIQGSLFTDRLIDQAEGGTMDEKLTSIQETVENVNTILETNNWPLSLVLIVSFILSGMTYLIAFLGNSVAPLRFRDTILFVSLVTFCYPLFSDYRYYSTELLSLLLILMILASGYLSFFGSHKLDNVLLIIILGLASVILGILLIAMVFMKGTEFSFYNITVHRPSDIILLILLTLNITYLIPYFYSELLFKMALLPR
ncbi:hypothetical protein [Pedobacter ghigonis]|uniref:hypothetical protein n=1 Tax=Pedobacter ghigonis TaxID=2730403 RepID=UPI00158938AE|nr:hypothetical protein [Pedobacter ghigonis]